MTEENVNMKKPTVDPGWNDPPMLTTSNVQPATKRNILNKRVAFPLFNGSGATASDGSSVHLNSTPSQPPLPNCPITPNSLNHPPLPNTPQ